MTANLAVDARRPAPLTTSGQPRALHPDAGPEEASGEPLIFHVARIDRGMPGVVITGELDVATGPLLDAHIRASYPLLPTGARPGPRGSFMVDLTDVSFLDSHGVEALRRIHGHLDAHPDDLRIVGPTARRPRWLLALAVRQGSLPAQFSPAERAT